ncbi:hypothetical protein J7E91_22615 [Streptomyces sp. ISL-99]|uniref:hypothetical protein n=1 Tax=Streptomyces sp. ISL-99 TaxID=2819193 RepID=UPI001BE5D6F3|nr:hypothetical protein [Streptomyces sp. ISL-99]MBT2528133.1 hypothetical protein [Streptomyces sp. ISL-99]
MNAKKVLAGSLLTLAATGFAASPAMAYEDPNNQGGHGKGKGPSFSQNIQIIDDVCPTIQDIDVITILEVLDEARVNQCHDMKKSAIVDNSDAPAAAVLGAVR